MMVTKAFAATSFLALSAILFSVLFQASEAFVTQHRRRQQQYDAKLFAESLTRSSSRQQVRSRSRVMLEPSKDRRRPADAFSSSSSTTGTTTALSMGLFDSIVSRFSNKDEGDFVRLEEMNEQFLGPGPVVLLYQIPDTIDDDEIRDMLADGAPKATQQGISLARISTLPPEPKQRPIVGADLVDLSLQKALEKVIRKKPPASSSSSSNNSPLGSFAPPNSNSITSPSPPPPPSIEGSPVAIFSGFGNAEMMESYNILGPEIYQEFAWAGVGGRYLACATAVPNAMPKPLRQVLTEISGDHAEALRERQPKEVDDEAGPRP